MSRSSSAIIDRCPPSQLKALLALAAGPARERVPMPTQAADPRELRQLLTELCQGRTESGELLLTTISTATTPLAVLRNIKDLAKKLLDDARTEAHRHAATFLYHAAIAAAFCHHGVNLSTRPIGARGTLYADLAAGLSGDPLGQMFQQAAERAKKVGAA